MRKNKGSWEERMNDLEVKMDLLKARMYELKLEEPVPKPREKVIAKCDFCGMEWETNPVHCIAEADGYSHFPFCEKCHPEKLPPSPGYIPGGRK